MSRGWIFSSGSYHALARRTLDMSVLVTFVRFGRWMEMKSRSGTSDALRAFFDLIPPSARVLRGDTEVTLPSSEVLVVHQLRLRPGGKIPIDGELTVGETDVDESLVTGERLPVTKRAGEGVVGGSIVAVQAAQVVLMRSDPGDIARAVRLSKATVRSMKQNLVWASVYNVLAIPVAAGIFYNSLGWSLRPEISALLMSASSIIVAVNAVSLR